MASSVLRRKFDTGARTSALHAFFIEPYIQDDRQWVRFGIHPLQKNTAIEHICCAPLFDRREVRDSGRHLELRYVIKTTVQIGQLNKHIEITLTNRETMLFRMLLGRTAIPNGVKVDPNHSFLLDH